MFNVSNVIFEKALLPYLKKTHYIKSCFVDYPSIEASFSIPHTYYVNPDIESGHLNFADIPICINQMCFMGIYDAASRNNIPNFSEKFYQNLEKNLIQNAVITKFSLDFRKPISPENFWIQMDIINQRDGKLPLFNSKFKIYDQLNSIFGKVNFAFVNNSFLE